MHKKFAREGFTLIELTLSILFISILSLAVALLIVNAITAYRRGITLSQVNDMGMELTDDMRAAVQSAQARSLEAECASFYSENDDARSQCEVDNASKISSIIKYADVTIGNETIQNAPVFGAFCAGSYSYIWNSGYFFNDEYRVQNLEAASLTYKNKDGYTGKMPNEENPKDIRLLKVLDENQEVCKSVIKGNYNGDDNFYGKFDISGDDYSIVEEEPTDILTGDITLALYDLSVGVTNESATLNNSLYSVSFILGTEQGGINVNVSGNYCAAPEDYEQFAVTNFDYCAINKFNFVAQANGG